MSEPMLIGEVQYLVKPDKFLLIGRIIRTQPGYRFHPNTSAHKSSTRHWPTMEACVPRWTRRYGDLSIMPKRQWEGIISATSRQQAPVPVPSVVVVPIAPTMPLALQAALDEIAENGRADSFGTVCIPRDAFLTLMTVRDDLAARDGRVQQPHCLV